ncbi:hypothetical protein BDA99DRAFT_558570 [Phascolomyces articulosus]|uniref:WRKY domain-containing protein n=1 Tax=Phascolomyces articulosus TaxID=60185 RepID=A0AAD5PFE1_9FUNG|nr:hypothetical protein BDA99DRAFT_558570 [Phascolomyces articulosus]
MIPSDSNSNNSSNRSSNNSNNGYSWNSTTSTRRLPAVLTPPLTITTETTSSLEDIIRQYSQKPEILELVLMSKVQEDRRRAEEAKLRSKEIDYMLQREQQQLSSSSSQEPSSPRSPDLHHHYLHPHHHSYHNNSHIHESQHHHNHYSSHYHNNEQHQEQQHRHSLPSLPTIMDLDKKVPSNTNHCSIPYRSPSLTSSSFGSPRSTPEHAPVVAASSPPPSHQSRDDQFHSTTSLHPTTTINNSITAPSDRLLPTIAQAHHPAERPPSPPVVSASQEIRQLIASRDRLSINGPSITNNETHVHGDNNIKGIPLPPPAAPILHNGYHSEKRRSLHDDKLSPSVNGDNISNAQSKHEQIQPPQPQPQQNNKTHIYHYYYGPTPPNKLPLPPAPQSNTMTLGASSTSSTANPLNTVQGRPFAKRRRREMQAITMIIETREFPYNDDYLWKNNGNTIHKGSGNKSIYYKCANNQKGCPVNKTVTFKDNGEYLIKYRGKHLSDCSRIKRVVDV